MNVPRLISRLRIPSRKAAMALGTVMLVYALMAMFFRRSLGVVLNSAAWYPNVSDAILLLTNLLAAAGLALPAIKYRNSNRRLCRAWLALSIAQACYVLGDLTLIIMQSISGEAPLVSIADIFYLVYYVVFAIGLLQLPVDSLTRDELRKTALDITIIMLAAGFLLWNFLIIPLQQTSTSSLERFIVVIYPLLDLVLFLALLSMLYRRSQYSAPIILLQAALMVGIFADVVYTLENLAEMYASGNLVDVVYAFSYCLTAMAGVLQFNGISFVPLTRPANDTPRLHRSNWLVYMPYAWIWIIFLVVVFHEKLLHLPDYVLYGTLGTTFFLVMIRQFLAFNENAELYLNELRRRRLAEALANAAREMSSSLDPRSMPLIIMDQLAQVVPYERCSVMLEKQGHLYIAAQRGFPNEGERTQEVKIALREGDPYLKMMETRQPQVLDDVTQVPGWTILPWVPLNKSWMGVPLIVYDRVIGMISITRKEAAAINRSEMILAISFAGQAAVALENARLYDDLNQAYRTLEILDKTKSSFINVVAHELRTPITVIKGYSQTMASMENIKADPQNRVILDGIVRGAERMQAVVNNMLDVTKIDTEVLKPHKETLLLDNLFKRIAYDFAAALKERRQTIILPEEVEQLPGIQADPELMRKVFYQLVMNAIKYTPDGGVITIGGKVDQDANMVDLTVTDTGIGISADQLEVIFEKFYQTGQVSLHSSGQTKFKGGGPGLGLPIARGIVVAHGGKIWAESAGHDEENYPGSRFHILLPL